MRRVVLIAALLFATPAVAAECVDARIDVCFRPGREACDRRIVDAIDGARETLLVQAYSFTSNSIIQAIGRSRSRGVNTLVVLDKDNLQARYTGATYLTNAGIPVRIDDKVAIAHNKVIIVDRDLVIGGSYNYTASAESRNAENVTFTRSACVASRFAENFDSRWRASTPYRPPGSSPQELLMRREAPAPR